MTSNNNTNLGKSQENYPYFYFFLLIPLFIVILFLNTTIFIKLLLCVFSALIPIFIFKPLYFLVFIFLVTPAIRAISQSEIIANFGNYSINFNFLLNFSILTFGGLYVLINFKKVLVLIKKNKYLVFFILFIILSLFSILYSINLTISIGEFFRIFILFIILLFSLLVINNKKDFYILLTSILLGSLLPAFFSIYQYLISDGWWDKTIMLNRINGTFLHPATLAFYLLFTTPIIYALFLDKIKKHTKLFLLLFLFLCFLIVILTLTRGAWVGMIIIFLAYGILRNRKFLLIILSTIFLSYLLIPTINERVDDVFSPKYNSSFTTRLRIVETTIPAIKDAPLLGNGLGTFGQVHLKYNKEARTYESLQAHNDYLRIIIELGLIGLLLYLSIFLSLFYTIIKLYKTKNKNLKNYLLSVAILWLGALAISFGDNILRTMPVQFLLWSYTGAVIAYANLKNKSR